MTKTLAKDKNQKTLEHAAEIARTLIADQAAINVKIVADAVQEATKLIASANESAVKLIASNAAESAKVLAARGNDDHDLLVELRTAFNLKMDALEKSIKELKCDYITKIDDHDSRIDKLETWRATLEGKASQSSVYIAYAFTFISLVIGAIAIFKPLFK